MPLRPIQTRHILKAWGLVGYWLLALGLTGFSTYAAEAISDWQAVPARPDVLRGADRRLLDRAEQFAADKKWEDALPVIMRLLEADIPAVVKLRDTHYVGLSEYCHRLLARFPAETLGRYRQLVDVASKSWYEQGIASRDARLLRRVVDESFHSEWGDDSLLALGELALERGDYQAARNAWSTLISQQDRLTYLETRISPASVLARLVVVSVREGNWPRAERELAELRRDYPSAAGWLAGRDVVFVDFLAQMLEQARLWPAGRLRTGWPTFAASAQRTRVRPVVATEGSFEKLWSHPLSNDRHAIFPIVSNGLVIYQTEASVLAFRLLDGTPEFAAKGTVFQSPTLVEGWLGQPRYTLTAQGCYVFGCTTAPLGQYGSSSARREASECWGIDLKREGALFFQQSCTDPKVTFAGAPLVVANRLLVACCENDRAARMGVACYDLDTHEQIWLRWICRSNTPASGRTTELAANLLTYDAGVIYCNTNLGAVAAVRAEDGRVLWLRTYQRQSAGVNRDGTCAFYHGPNPCVYSGGAVFVLPTDSSTLLAFDAGTGNELWRYAVADPAAQLLGATHLELSLLTDAGLQRLCPNTGELILSEEKSPTSSHLPAISKHADLLSVGDYWVATSPTELMVFRRSPESVPATSPVETPKEQ